MAPQDLWIKKDGSRSARYGRGKRWRVSYVDPNTGQTKNPAFSRKVDAERFENNIKADISRGRYVDPQAGRITVAAYVDGWFSRQQVRENSRRRMKGVIENHVKPVLGHLTMLQVRSGTIQDWVANRQRVDGNGKAPLAAASIRTTYRSVVFPMFKRAAIDGVIGTNPCVDIVLPQLPDGVYDLPSVDEIAKLADCIDEPYAPAVFVAAGCGLRTGEVFGLELEDVDFLRRVVHVRNQALMSAKGAVRLAPLKTKTSKRTIELPTEVLERLARHVELFPPRPTLIWDHTAARPKQREARLLWLDPKGRPMRSMRWTEVWVKAVERAGFPPGLYSMTSLRHFFATALIYDGKNVKTVQMAMGHAKPTVTLETYLGYWPDDARDGTRTVMDAVFTTAGVRTASVPLEGP